MLAYGILGLVIGAVVVLMLKGARKIERHDDDDDGNGGGPGRRRPVPIRVKTQTRGSR